MNYLDFLTEYNKILKLINERNERLKKMSNGKRPYVCLSTPVVINNNYIEARLDNDISDVTYIKDNFLCQNP